MIELTNILIRELMSRTEQWLLKQKYKKSTLGVYKATWNRFLSYSKSEYYDRLEVEQFLLKYFGVDVSAINQKLDARMHHARRHMNALDEFYRHGYVCRREIRGLGANKDDKYETFFGEYLKYCNQQNYSKSWISNTTVALKIFLLAIHSSKTDDVRKISVETIDRFGEILSNVNNICANVRHARCLQVATYLHWLYLHKYTDKDYSPLLPKFKRTPPAIPHVWEEADIEKIISVIDTANPVGKRNYAIFLLLARTGLRISDVISLKFSNLDWKNNCIVLSQQKTKNVLSLPLSKEIGLAIITYLKHGRPNSSSEFIFLSHIAPFHPLGIHNNFNSEMQKYMRRAGITRPKEKHSGVHTIRHSFATNMLKQGASLDNLSQILGHSNINVTETYLRVDVEQLRICALDMEVIK